MGDLGDVRVTLATPEHAKELFDVISDLYDEVFSEPPHPFPDFESPQQRKTLRSVIANPNSAITLAETDGGLVGFCYGVPMRVGGQFWAGFREPVPEKITTEWPGRTFFVIELAVRQSWRRHGIGRRLLGAVLDGRSEERAALSTQPEPETAHAFYRALGWTLVGRQDTPGLISPEFDIYVTRLPMR
jgi:ribosomal protein S18 acetylase RimI-like enzyme